MKQAPNGFCELTRKKVAKSRYEKKTFPVIQSTEKKPLYNYGLIFNYFKIRNFSKNYIIYPFFGPNLTWDQIQTIKDVKRVLWLFAFELNLTKLENCSYEKLQAKKINMQPEQFGLNFHL